VNVDFEALRTYFSRQVALHLAVYGHEPDLDRTGYCTTCDRARTSGEVWEREDSMVRPIPGSETDDEQHELVWRAVMGKTPTPRPAPDTAQTT
jgi:hypothetical protein